MLLLSILPQGLAADNGVFTIGVPAEVVGDSLTVAWATTGYLAAYDLDNVSKASFAFEGMSEDSRIEFYDAEFVQPVPENGFQRVPESERRNALALPGGLATISIVEVFRNFTVVIRNNGSALLDPSGGLLLAPQEDAWLLAPAGLGGAKLQPGYDQYNWTPHPVALGLDGAHHHFQTNLITGEIEGAHEVWLNNCVIELKTRSTTERYRLGTDVTFGTSPLSLGSAAYAHYNASFLRAHLRGTLQVGIEAPVVRVLSPEPFFQNVSHLAAPLASGMLDADGETISFDGKDHLDLRGVMELRAEPPERKANGAILQSQVRLAVSGDVASVAANRGPVSPIGATGVAVGGLTALALLLLLLRQLIPLYSLLRREDLLNHPKRDAIHRAIQENQGISFEELRTSLATVTGRPLANGTLLYHLWRLQETKLIYSSQAERSRVYFTVATENWEDQAQRTLLAGKAARKLAQTVLENPGLTHAQLALTLGGAEATARQRCRHHLQKLLGAKLVAQERDGRQRRYRPTEQLRLLLETEQPTPRPVTTRFDANAAKSA